MVVRYMLDTDACIALIKNRPEAMRVRLTRLSPEEVGISGIVAAELWFGVARAQEKRQNEASPKDFMDYATVLDWPVEASPLYGKIREFRNKGGLLGPWISLSRSTPFFSMRFW